MKKVFVYNTNREELAERISEEFGDEVPFVEARLESGDIIWSKNRAYLGITKDPDNLPYGMILCRDLWADAYKEEEREEGMSTRLRRSVEPLIGFVAIEPDREGGIAWLRSRKKVVNLARHVVQEWTSSLRWEGKGERGEVC